MSQAVSVPEVTERIIVREYPNTVFLWPTMLFGYLIFIWNYILGSILNDPTVGDASVNATWAAFWLLILFFNLIVMSYDFKLGKIFSMFLVVLIGGALYIFWLDKIIAQSLPDFSLNAILVALDLVASANFYLVFSSMILLLFLMTWVVSRFTYWEFTSNRIVHHKGMFEREESFSAQASRVITTVEDLFERALFKSGTITIIDSDKNIHILRNVYDAVKKDRMIQELLQHQKVQVVTQSG